MRKLFPGRGALRGLLVCLLLCLSFAVPVGAAETVDDVHSIYYQGIMKSTVKATSANGKKKTFKKGKKVTVKSRNSKKGKYTIVSNGETYKVSKKKVRIVDFVSDGKHPYKTSVAEEYVNSKGWKSKTKYLIWISSYKQHLYVFKGSKRNWKVVRHWKCTTGRYEFRTKLGKTSIRRKSYSAAWDADHLMYYCSWIRGGAIHSWTYKASGQRRSGKPGKPRSRGCVRLEKENAKWVYSNVPTGTTVWIR